jgi:hypothetical protein
MTLPQWSTPQRREHLVELFHKYGNLCLQGHPVCPDETHYKAGDFQIEWRSTPDIMEFRTRSGEKTNIFVQAWKRERVRVEGGHYPARLYNKVAEAAIESWKAEDRERRSYEWDMEQLQIFDGTYGRYGSTFDPVARDVYVNGRPEYYLVGLGVNPFTYKRVALVRVPSTLVHLFVDVGTVVQEVSKNARRKAVRHGKVSGNLMDRIDLLCRAAVADWWAAR